MDFEIIRRSKVMYFLAAVSACPFAKMHSFKLPMNQLSFYVFLLHLMFFCVKAQNPSNQYDLASQDAMSNFQPSLAVVIGVLSLMFSLTFVLLVYAKFCHRSASVSVHNQMHIQDGLPRSRSRSSGIDKTVIESLPFFRFSSLKGSREGLECAICLSRFEDIEILRLLPKCKHAFHIDCLDQWLEKHSSCPLCRDKISADDASTITYSNSLRFLWNQSERRTEESNIELYIQREESHRGSSRYSITSSFRKTDKGNNKEEELPIQQSDETDEDEKSLHKFNHKIIVSDVVLKNRWSNVSSSDLMFLNSEMLHQISSHRFSELEINRESSTPTRVFGDGETMHIKEEMDRKREFENKLSRIKQNESFPPIANLPKESETKGISENSSKVLNPSDKRSMSEIIVHSRFQDFNNRTTDNLEPENAVKEEKIRKLWLPIATRTVEWFANRERRTSTDQSQITRLSSNI